MNYFSSFFRVYSRELHEKFPCKQSDIRVMQICESYERSVLSHVSFGKLYD